MSPEFKEDVERIIKELREDGVDDLADYLESKVEFIRIQELMDKLGD